VTGTGKLWQSVGTAVSATTLNTEFSAPVIRA
jgi:hypothetical protein